MTINELVQEYLIHASGYYRDARGRATNSISSIRPALRMLDETFGTLSAEALGPLKLIECRQQWVDKGISRNTCNKYTHIVRRAFRWAVSQEKISVTVYQSLLTVDALKKGRSNARETEPVTPVPAHDLKWARRELPAPLKAVVDLQLLVPARPSELLLLRPCDIDMADPQVWFVRLDEHKTAYRGRVRDIAFGPRAQEILQPFLQREGEAYLFNPRDVAGFGPRARDRYTVSHYRWHIARACQRAGVSHWHPYRLKHNAATAIRSRYGLEAAQVACGHERADITEIYAERDRALLIKVTTEMG